MAANDYSYCIPPSSIVTEALVDKCIQTSLATCRRTLAGVDPELCVLKYRGTQPPELAGYTEHTNEEVRAILAGPDWTPPDP